MIVFLLLLLLMPVVLSWLPTRALAGESLLVPSFARPLQVAIPVNARIAGIGGGWELVEGGTPARPIPVDVMTATAADGTPDAGQRLVMGTIPPSNPGSFRAHDYQLQRTGALSDPSFKWDAQAETSIRLTEHGRPVLVYNQGRVSREGVPADRARSSYVHPLYDLDGRVLSDDFPPDHYHHRGLFWSWPHVSVGGKQYDLWMLKGIEHRFERWLAKDSGRQSAVLGVENSWVADGKKVMVERAWLRVYAADARGRIVDVDLYWIPTEAPVTLAGAEGKSYGGITLRYATNQSTTITTPSGAGKEDLYITPLPWADLSGVFTGATAPSGAAILISPRHPDFPPTWLTRHYGVLCVGWPGVTGKTFPKAVPIHCQYRVWVHRGQPDVASLSALFEDYEASLPPVGRPAIEVR